MVGYQGHVIPVIIAVWILSVLEKKLHKVVPAALDLFVTPLVSVFVTGYLTLSIVGPIFVWGENAILGAIQWMLTLPLGLGSLIMGGLYAPTVVTGIHQMYTAIDIGQLAKYGVTYWLPLASAANVAQGAAALAVGIKSKDQKVKSLALPSSLSAFMGITEPAIFGVNLRFFKPFIAGCIGGGCGALYASLVHLGAKGTGVTGIFGILLCLNQPLQYIIEMAISVGVAFVISFMIYKDKEPVVKTAATETTVEKTEETENVVEAENVSAEEITSPVNGNVVATAEVADETFASEMLGTTVAVEPTDGKIVAPCDGEVMNIFDTGHAVCIATEAGAELLIHIGIDTVSMDGKGFVKAISEVTSIPGKKAVIFGAGGAARAIAVEMALAGVGEIIIVNVSERGKSLSDLLNSRTPAKASFLPWNRPFSIPSDADIVINATPVGLYPNVEQRLNIRVDTLLPQMIVADCIPNPVYTHLLKDALANGCKHVLPGMNMLVYQAMIAIKYWTGKDVDADIMKQELMRVLGLSKQ